MSDAELVEAIVRRVSEQPLGAIGPESRISDLGLDSVDYAEVAAQIEETLDLDIPFTRWLEARTVRDVLALIDRERR